ncbi:hypothetical protein ACFP3Q_07775 [Nocardioides sp. GCM10027113]|uniref:hypothetical protein n=1 Tax=unclassified Nocardioides TaxID=2615069 RepID=UPI0036119687
MSTPNDTEDLLRDALHAQADRTTYEPTRAADVASRARFAQRRQNRGRLLVAAAAAAAIALPVGAILADRPATAPAPAEPPGKPVTLRLDSAAELPQGAPPAVDHAFGGTYVFADGDTVELPVGGGPIRDAAPYLDGVLVASLPRRNGGYPLDLTLVDRNGETRWTRCGLGPRVSGDGSTTGFAWMEGDCDISWRGARLEWGPATDSGPVSGGPLAQDAQISPVAVTEDRIVYNIGEYDPAVEGVRIAEGRSGPEVVPGVAWAATAAPEAGLVGGIDDTGTWGVYDESGDGVLRLRDRNERPVSFSPDARFVVTRHDAGGNPTLRIREIATGRAVVTLQGLGLGGAFSWEDPLHVLLACFDGDGRQSLVRLGVDGSLERATPARESTQGDYLLPRS